MIQLLEIGLIAMLFFFVQQKIYKRLWNKNLTASLSFQTPCIVEGEEGALREVIENRKRLPLSMLKVKFQTSRNLIFDTTKGSRTTDRYYRNDVFHVGGGEKITRTVHFIGGKRGYYQLESLDLVASDLFLTTEMVENISVNKSIYVYPRPFDSKEFRLSLQQLNGEILTKKHLLEDPFEYRGIREYQPFDDIRSINWKATAKTDELKVTQKNYTSLPAIRIFLNIEDNGILKKEECVEACFQIAAGLSKFFLSQGVRVSCYGNGVDIFTEKPTVIEESTGNGQLEQIYRTLARVDTAKPVVDFKKVFGEKLLEQSGSTITCIVAPNQYSHFVELMESFPNTGNDYIWFYPVWENTDPELPQSLKEHIRILHIRN
uniref:DUF58 domain-containing protein n=1 Tax=Acetatifactor sp. TaxID=1872090 RepID=UPI0040572EBD